MLCLKKIIIVKEQITILAYWFYNTTQTNIEVYSILNPRIEQNGKRKLIVR
jgi:hypothetical protein